MEASATNEESPARTPRPITGWKRLIVGRYPRRTLIRALVTVAVCLLVSKYVLLPVRISGPSMTPTYQDRSINCINRLAYAWSKPKRGDVVAIKTTGFHIMYLKRVVALPGESVSISRGLVHINGQPLDEPYVKVREKWERGTINLGADQYFVIGDNRGMDQSLHDHGWIARRKIAGKPLW